MRAGKEHSSKSPPGVVVDKDDGMVDGGWRRRREDDDGSNWPWCLKLFVCVSWCVERAQKI